MDVIIVILVLVFGFFLKNRYKVLTGKEHVLLDQLFFYHMIMSFVFYLYIRLNGGDSQIYWNTVKEIEFSQLWAEIIHGSAGPTDYMFLINFVPSNILGLDFFTATVRTNRSLRCFLCRSYQKRYFEINANSIRIWKNLSKYLLRNLRY